MKKFILFITAISLSIGGFFAQNKSFTPSTSNNNYERINLSSEKCSTTEVMNALRDKDPIAFDTREAQKEQQYQNWIKNEYQNFKSSKKAVITIPVVVQIWASTTTVPNSKVYEQLNRLNLDFRGANPDRTNTPSVFPTADSEIEFCLATRDPSGNPTSGIIRRTSGGSPPQSGGTEMWDPTKYLNIYVYNINGALGFTYLSSQSPNQAVHVTISAFGNTGGQYGMGRTATHEIGHWFNLQHIWGNNNCGNDFVNDTPPAQSANYNCPSHPHDVGVCAGNTNGEMFMNYMDYVNDACMYAFTPGQKARMIAAINNDRPGLLTSNGCQATGLTANFTANNTTITAGQTVTFTNTSSGPNPITSNSWNFDVTSQGGVTPSTSTAATPPSITYNNAGTYTVSLTVGDGSSTDTETKNAYITVLATGSSVCDSTAANWSLAQHGSQTGPYLWGGGNGYILGQNTYGDNGWADKVPYTGSGTFLTDVIYYFSTSGTGNVNLKVWGVNAGAPGAVLAQQTVQISQLGTGGTPTVWSISTPPSLNGNFFVGHDHTSLTNGDTVALMSAPTTTPSTWAKETTGWKALSSYNFNHSGAVIPVICNTTTGEKEILGTINDILVFPNPSNGTLNIALTEKKETTIEIYNLVGKLVYTSGNPLNTQLFTINIEDQPNGIYFVNIKTENNITTKKVLIAK